MSIKVNIKNVSYKNKNVLNNINFDCLDNSITAVIGRNGSGKSTLVSAITSNINFNGDIIIDDKNIDSLTIKTKSMHISAIFQKLNTPHITIKELVTMGRYPYTPLNNKLSSNDIDIINKALEDADLKSIENCFLDKISGGEVKRAYFGMVLAQNTNNIILDEATSFMDKDYERKFLNLIKNVAHQNKKCIVLVMHNIDNAIKYADNILLLDNGKQIFFGSKETILNTTLIEEYLNLERIVIKDNIFFK